MKLEGSQTQREKQIVMSVLWDNLHLKKVQDVRPVEQESTERAARSANLAFSGTVLTWSQIPADPVPEEHIKVPMVGLLAFLAPLESLAMTQEWWNVTDVPLARSAVELSR